MLDEFVHQHRIVVSYVHGPAVGAGMEIMLASDLVVMEPRAWCELPPARLGFALDNWSIRRLADIVGLGHARSILLACERVTATRAVEIGLAHEVGNLDDAHALCARVGSYPPLGIAELKAVLNDACYTHELSPSTSGFSTPPGPRRGASGGSNWCAGCERVKSRYSTFVSLHRAR